MLPQPEKKAEFQAIHTYSIIAWKSDSNTMAELIKFGKGTAAIRNIQGGTIWFIMKGNKIPVRDEQGSMAKFTIQNIFQNNGIIFLIDKDLKPK